MTICSFILGSQGLQTNVWGQQHQPLLQKVFSSNAGLTIKHWAYLL